MLLRIVKKYDGTYRIQKEVTRKSLAAALGLASSPIEWEYIDEVFYTVPEAENYIRTVLNIDIKEEVIAEYSNNVKYPNP